MNFLRVLFILVLFPVITVRADNCDKSVAQLGSNSEPSREAPRKVVLDQLAELYSAAINGKAPMDAALSLMKDLAERELRTVADVRQEIELLLYSPSERSERAEERRERRAEEQSRLYEGLEPYLARIGKAHRKIIEEQLIRRGLVSPLSTGEVEFQFRGTHTFLVGDEGKYGAYEGRIKEASFGLGSDFAIGQVPVTQFMYFLAALGEDGVNPTPSEFTDGEGAVALYLGGRTYQFKPNHPVEAVSHSEAEAHAVRVSKIMEASYGLPTEVQWEFANRAGSIGKFHFGDDVSLLPHYGWFFENSGRKTHEVGQLRENAFHLYDTHGNVWEWTSSPHEDHRIVRGGSWSDGAGYLRSARRIIGDPGHRVVGRGIRLERQSAANSYPSYTFTLGNSEPGAKPGSLIEGGPR
jgi:hypothetical protein